MLNFDPELERQAIEAIGLFTREKMWSLHHIPLRYYLPPGDGAEQEFEQLQTELQQYGRILLDRTGKPACLSGKQPVLAEQDLHGPWREEEEKE